MWILVLTQKNGNKICIVFPVCNLHFLYNEGLPETARYHSAVILEGFIMRAFLKPLATIVR